jgi:RecA/RadA recombinase
MTQKERLAAAKAAADKINKEFKGEIVVAAEDAHGKSFLRRPSGIMQLDIDTGGGLPAGSFNTISGPNNAGKSTILYYYFAEHQRLYGEEAYCALILSEGNVDYDQARRCGWVIPYPEEVIAGKQQARRELGVPDFTDEELADLRRSVGVNHIVYGLSTAEEMLDVAEKLLATNLYGIIGLDSYEGLMPNAEASLESLEDHPQQAARATAIGRFLQHYGPIKRNPLHFTTFIMTCQIRFNRKKQEAQTFMQKYLKDWAEVVPDVVKHWRTIAITLWASGKEKEKGGKDEKGEKMAAEVVGKNVHWEIAKGKDGTHDNIMGSTTYWYDPRCFDLQRTVIQAGLRYGVIREVEGLLTLYKNGEPHEYLANISGPETFVQALLEEPEAEWDARHTILHAIGKDCLYR